MEDNLAINTNLPKLPTVDIGQMSKNISLPNLNAPTLPGIPDAPIRTDLANRAIKLGTEQFIGPQLHSQMLGNTLGQIGRGRESAMQGLSNRFAARGGAMTSPLLSKLESNIAAQNIGQQADATTNLATNIAKMNREAAERGTQIGQQSQEQLLGAWGTGLGAQSQLAGIGSDIYRTQASMLPTYLQAQMQPAELQAKIYGTNLQAYPDIVQSQFIPADIAAKIYSPYLAAQANNYSGLASVFQNFIGDLIGQVI